MSASRVLEDIRGRTHTCLPNSIRLIANNKALSVIQSNSFVMTTLISEPSILVLWNQTLVLTTMMSPG